MKPKAVKYLQIAVALLLLAAVGVSSYLIISVHLDREAQVETCLNQRADGIVPTSGHPWGLNGGCNWDCTHCSNWLDLNLGLGVAILLGCIPAALLMLSSLKPKKILSWIAVVLFMLVTIPTILGFAYDMGTDYEPLKLGVVSLLALFLIPIYLFLWRADSLRWLQMISVNFKQTK